jgi:hypothetical protein
MLGRIGSATIALGLTVALPGALAQEGIEPALESQPVAEPRQEPGTEQGEDHAAQEQTEAGQIEPALKAIETAIRDLIAEEDTIERERQQQREMADLEAQQEMALWAERMTWATWASVGLTFVGLILIGRTMLYTRDAALYTGDAALHTKTGADAAVATADEARKQTVVAVKAADTALSANEINRESMIAQQRAWLAWNINEFEIVSPLKWNGRNGAVTIKRKVRNIGQSPALDVCVFTQTSPFSLEKCDASIEVVSKTCIKEPMTGTAIFPNDVFTFENATTINESGLDANGEITPLYVTGIGYRLAFGQERHRTIAIVQIARKPGPAGRIPIGPAYGDVPVDQLYLRLASVRRAIIAD